MMLILARRLNAKSPAASMGWMVSALWWRLAAASIFMKIMRLESRPGGYAAGSAAPIIRQGTPFPASPSGAATTPRRISMQWQTPQACDFRFGFEITMYVAAR